MGDDTKPDMTEASPRVHAAESPRAYAPRGIGALIPAIARPAFRRRSPGAAQILADWAAIVGPALATTTTPRRLSGGRLAIACVGPVAMELQHLAPQLIARINAHVGQALVTELRFIQDHRPLVELPSPRPSPLDAQAVDQLTRQLAPLPDGPVRAALDSLGRSVHTAHARAARKPSTSRPTQE